MAPRNGRSQKKSSRASLWRKAAIGTVGAGLGAAAVGGYLLNKNKAVKKVVSKKVVAAISRYRKTKAKRVTSSLKRRRVLVREKKLTKGRVTGNRREMSNALNWYKSSGGVTGSKAGRAYKSRHGLGTAVKKTRRKYNYGTVSSRGKGSQVRWGSGMASGALRRGVGSKAPASAQPRSVRSAVQRIRRPKSVNPRRRTGR